MREIKVEKKIGIALRGIVIGDDRDIGIFFLSGGKELLESIVQRQLTGKIDLFCVGGNGFLNKFDVWSANQSGFDFGKLKVISCTTDRIAAKEACMKGITDFYLTLRQRSLRSALENTGFPGKRAKCHILPQDGQDPVIDLLNLLDAQCGDVTA